MTVSDILQLVSIIATFTVAIVAIAISVITLKKQTKLQKQQLSVSLYDRRLKIWYTMHRICRFTDDLRKYNNNVIPTVIGVKEFLEKNLRSKKRFAYPLTQIDFIDNPRLYIVGLFDQEIENYFIAVFEKYKKLIPYFFNYSNIEIVYDSPSITIQSRQKTWEDFYTLVNNHYSDIRKKVLDNYLNFSDKATFEK